MGELGCRPTRYYVPSDDGEVRRVRGYLTADLLATIAEISNSSNGGVGRA